MQGLLDFESPEDLERDPGDLEEGSAKVLDAKYCFILLLVVFAQGWEGLWGFCFSCLRSRLFKFYKIVCIS